MPQRHIPPPPLPNFVFEVILLIFALQEWIASTFVPPPIPAWTIQFLVFIQSYLSISLTLMQRLFPWFRPIPNQGKDIYNSIRRTPYNLWYLSGETVESFENIVQTIGWEVSAPRRVSHQPRTNRRCRCLLDIHNRILLVLMWLKKYPTYFELSTYFSVSPTTIFEEVYHIVPILFVNYQRLVSWLNLVRWARFRNTWSTFPNIVGMIDGTIHPIRRPTGDLQREFYRGDKKRHFMSSQIIIDPNGMIVLLVSGFPSHLNDAQTYRMIPSVGPNGVLRLPMQCRLVSDGGHSARVPLVRPRLNARNRRARVANRELRKIRIKIEHAIGYLKVYQSTSAIFRHKRPFLPIVVQTCGFLTNRKRLQLRRVARQ